MKLVTSLAVILAVFLSACNKPATQVENEEVATNEITGSWKMIAVQDIASGTITSKPSTIQKDVVITLVATGANTGTFTGFTPSNTIDENPYTVGNGQALAIPTLSMTKIKETSWGNEFVKNITAAMEYHLEPAILHIKTPSKMLVFIKN